jgi:hypothetical protein
MAELPFHLLEADQNPSPFGQLSFYLSSLQISSKAGFSMNHLPAGICQKTTIPAGHPPVYLFTNPASGRYIQ